VFVPLMAPLVFMMGVGPLARWKQTEVPDLARRLRWAAGVAIVATVLTEWFAGKISWLGGLGLLLSFWIVASITTDLWERVRPAGGVRASVWHRLRQIPRAMAGMMLAHLGIAVFIFGVTMVKTYEVERDVNMGLGDTTEIAGWVFTFRGVRDVPGPNYTAAQGLVVLSKDGREVAQLRPEKRVYRVQQNPMTEAAIRSRPAGDIYVALGQPAQGDAWVVRVYYKPFVTWIWGGCVLMALGGALAASDRRYRTARREQEALAPQAGAATA
jgi:cytochrome c-type biogenesis protein CcmF